MTIVLGGPVGFIPQGGAPYSNWGHDKITTTGVLSLRDGVKAVVYGASGTGKTRLCATLPRPLILSAEKGTLSLRRENLPVWEIATLSDMREAVTFLAQSSAAKNFDAVCVDSMSDVAQITLADALKKNKDPRKAYGDYANEYMDMLRFLRTLKEKHVYYVAKESYDKDEMTGGSRFAPMMPGRQLSLEVPYLVDELFRLIVSPDGTQTALQTRATAVVVAKDRSGALDFYEPPNLGAAFAKMMQAA